VVEVLRAPNGHGGHGGHVQLDEPGEVARPAGALVAQPDRRGQGVCQAGAVRRVRRAGRDGLLVRGEGRGEIADVAAVEVPVLQRGAEVVEHDRARRSRPGEPAQGHALAQHRLVEIGEPAPDVEPPVQHDGEALPGERVGGRPRRGDAVTRVPDSRGGVAGIAGAVVANVQQRGRHRPVTRGRIGAIPHGDGDRLVEVAPPSRGLVPQMQRRGEDAAQRHAPPRSRRHADQRAAGGRDRGGQVGGTAVLPVPGQREVRHRSGDRAALPVVQLRRQRGDHVHRGGQAGGRAVDPVTPDGQLHQVGDQVRVAGGGAVLADGAAQQVERRVEIGEVRPGPAQLPPLRQRLREVAGEDRTVSGPPSRGLREPADPDGLVGLRADGGRGLRPRRCPRPGVRRGACAQREPQWTLRDPN
jgi:hypothetical protein